MLILKGEGDLWVILKLDVLSLSLDFVCLLRKISLPQHPYIILILKSDSLLDTLNNKNMTFTITDENIKLSNLKNGKKRMSLGYPINFEN